MYAAIVERNGLTEYLYKGQCVMVAIKDSGQWMLTDTGIVKNITHFAAFFRTKKELEKSFLFNFLKEVAKIQK